MPPIISPEKKNIIRHLYLYAISLISLVLMIVSSIGFINLVVKEYVLDVKSWSEMDVYSYQCSDETLFFYYDNNGIKVERAPVKTTDQKQIEKDKCVADALEKAELQANNDNKRDIATWLSMLIVAIPLYFFHWRIIRKKNKK